MDPLRLDFDWGWGFRLGMGYNIPRDGWDIGLNWLHMENRAHAQKSGEAIAQVWSDPRALIPISGVSELGTGHWKVNLEQLDLQLGREFYVGRYLTLRPHVGVRTAFILQRFKATVTVFSPARGDLLSSLRNKFWGFGFSGGLGTDWRLGYGLSLFGDASFSLLSGYFKVREGGDVLVGSTKVDRWDSDSSFRSEKPIFDLEMGFKWFGKFCDDHFGLTFKAAYEYHLYMNQNQWQQPSGSLMLLTPVATPGDLGYQGVTLSMQFDF